MGMLMEEMYQRMDMYNVLIQSFNFKIGCTKIMAWTEFESHSPEHFLNRVNELIGDDKMITTGSWCFDPISYNRLFEAYVYLLANSTYSPIIFPEMNLLLICKDKETSAEAFSKLPLEAQQKAMVNIINSEENEEGVILTYNNRTSFVPWLERPDYVYDIIESDRANEQQ